MLFMLHCSVKQVEDAGLWIYISRTQAAATIRPDTQFVSGATTAPGRYRSLSPRMRFSGCSPPPPLRTAPFWTPLMRTGIASARSLWRSTRGPKGSYDLQAKDFW